MMPGVLVMCAGIVLRMSGVCVGSMPSTSRWRCMLMGVMSLMLLMMMMVLVLVVHG